MGQRGRAEAFASLLDLSLAPLLHEAHDASPTCLDLVHNHGDVGKLHQGLGAAQRERPQAGAIASDQNQSRKTLLAGHFVVLGGLGKACARAAP